ncbi:asparagine synthase-related protein, partial [Verrucomicrobiota bacterium]
MTVTATPTTKRKRVAVAMSGGTDSSVAAALLVDQGLEVIGLTAHMRKEGSRCCSVEDVDHARKVASFLGIDHHVLDASEVFRREVVDPFVAEYARGRTPSPCVICNQMVKFGFLLTRGVQFDCVGLATGHYARVEQKDGCYRL